MRPRTRRTELANKARHVAVGALDNDLVAPPADERQRSLDRHGRRAPWRFRFSMIAALALVACSPPCGDDRVIEAASPDDALVARAAVRNCGATTSYVGIVEVRQNRRWFQSPCMVFAQPWVMNPSVSWSGNKQLVIACNGCPSMRSSVKACKGLDVQLVHRPEVTGPSDGSV